MIEIPILGPQGAGKKSLVHALQRAWGSRCLYQSEMVFPHDFPEGIAAGLYYYHFTRYDISWLLWSISGGQQPDWTDPFLNDGQGAIVVWDMQEAIQNRMHGYWKIQSKKLNPDSCFVICNKLDLQTHTSLMRPDKDLPKELLIRPRIVVSMLGPNCDPLVTSFLDYALASKELASNTSGKISSLAVPYLKETGLLQS